MVHDEKSLIGETVKVRIRSRSDLDKHADSQLIVKGFSSGIRTMRAVKALLICWAIAVFCVLIPMLHFVLVPLFFLAGIFMFFNQMSVHSYLVSGTIPCPACQKEVILKPMAFDWPKREICNYCRADLSISPQTSS